MTQNKRPRGTAVEQFSRAVATAVEMGQDVLQVIARPQPSGRIAAIVRFPGFTPDRGNNLISGIDRDSWRGFMFLLAEFSSLASKKGIRLEYMVK